MNHFEKNKVFYGFLKRFTITHVVTYLVCGLIFMYLIGYEQAFKENENFAHFRSLDSPVVRAGILFQFLRGGLFAFILFPFRETIVNSKYGWLMLFGIIFGMTAIGAVNASPGSIEGFIYTTVSIKEHLIGLPEVIVQAISFSVLFWLGERKRQD